VKVLSLILRVITAIAVLACVYGYWHTLEQRSKLENNLTQSRRTLQEKLQSLQRVETENDQLKAELQAERDQSAELQARADGYQLRFEQALAELDKLRNAQGGNDQSQLEAEIAQLRSALIEARTQSGDPSPYIREIAALRAELAELKSANTPGYTASNPTALAPTPATSSVPLPSASPGAPLGKVVRVGPDGSFVIVDFGEVRGARKNRVLDAIREGTRVGRMRLTQVTNDFSVAQVLPDSNLNPNEPEPDIRAGDVLYEAQSI